MGGAGKARQRPAPGGVQVLSLALSFSVPSVQRTGCRVGTRRRCQALGGLNLGTMLTDPMESLDA